MTTQSKKNSFAALAAIVGSIVAIGAGIGFGYDTLIAPKVQDQIDTCIKEADVKTQRDIQEIKNDVKELRIIIIELQKSNARIEGKLETIK